jgi:hypothetical protein
LAEGAHLRRGARKKIRRTSCVPAGSTLPYLSGFDAFFEIPTLGPMALPFSPIHQDLTSVLQDLDERTGPDGQLWCPAHDSMAIAKTIIDRTETLGILLLTTVRFARLAARAGAPNYVDFVYRRALPVLRADGFRTAVQRARGAGRLPRSAFDIDHSRIRLLEPKIARNLAGEIKPFEISFAQMPRLAAFLDVLHNTLGYDVVAELLLPITASEPTRSAEDVARELRARFNAWLQPRLESAHRRTQAKIIHAFLASQKTKSDKALRLEDVNEEIIFRFWVSRATEWHNRFHAAAKLNDLASARTAEKAAADEGFRLYRSCVRNLLRYRRALEDAAVEKAVGGIGEIDADHLTREELHAVSDSTPRWSNPLERLLSPPADGIKWLTNVELKQLTNYLGNPTKIRSRAPRETDGHPDDAEDASDTSALMEDQPFNLRFARTLLRVDVFGDAQAKLVARLRKRMPPSQAVEEALSDVQEDAYQKAALQYSEIRGQIRLEALAALHILGNAGDPLSLLLIEQFGDRDAFDSALSITTNSDETAPESHWKLSALFAGAEPLPNAALPSLLSEAKGAVKKVHREGFRPQEVGTGQIKAALGASVGPVIDLAKALDRICDHLDQATFIEDAGDDKIRFESVFHLLYWLDQEEAPRGD